MLGHSIAPLVEDSRGFTDVTRFFWRQQHLPNFPYFVTPSFQVPFRDAGFSVIQIAHIRHVPKIILGKTLIRESDRLVWRFTLYIIFDQFSSSLFDFIDAHLIQRRQVVRQNDFIRFNVLESTLKLSLQKVKILAAFFVLWLFEKRLLPWFYTLEQANFFWHLSRLNPIFFSLNHGARGSFLDIAYDLL